jgi:hypothetical protein
VSFSTMSAQCPAYVIEDAVTPLLSAQHRAVKVVLVSARRRQYPLLQRQLRLSSQEVSARMVHVDTIKLLRVKAQLSVAVVLPQDTGEPT